MTKECQFTLINCSIGNNPSLRKIPAVGVVYGTFMTCFNILN